MGKTSLATNIAFNIAKAYRRGRTHDGSEGAVEGGVVGFFSLEMSSEQLAARILSEASEVPSEQIRPRRHDRGRIPPLCRSRQIPRILPLYIDDTPALPISQVAARARRLKRTHGLDVLMVDYLQLLKGTGRGETNRVQEVSEITQGLKAIAKELNIPVVALSQLSRTVESRDDKRPQLSDLRESGSIEQDADVRHVRLPRRILSRTLKPQEDDPKFPEWLDKMNRVHGKAEVVIGKQRHGPIGTVELSFEGRFTRFGNLAQPWQGDGQSAILTGRPTWICT